MLNSKKKKKKKKKSLGSIEKLKRSVRRKFFADMRYREAGTYARYRIYVRERDKSKKVLRKARKNLKRNFIKK